MAQPYTTVPISIALVLDSEGKLLWVWDDEWGCFALPMTRPRVGESDMERHDHAARRAGAKALGVPVQVGQSVELEPHFFVSRRDFSMRRYRYSVYRVNPHPDFASAQVISGAHLWLAHHRALSDAYEPLSDSCRWVVAGLVHRGLLPGRSQYTAALVLHRTHSNRRQFLLRREPGWGYSLPTTRRRKEESYEAAAERAARTELGLDPDSLGLQPACESVVTDRDLSQAEQTPTFYSHGVFEAALPGATKFTSSNPLVWADAETVVAGQVHDKQTVDGQRAPDDRVSPTARHILFKLDHIPTLDPELVKKP